jgi:hypothetical protein
LSQNWVGWQSSLVRQASPRSTQRYISLLQPAGDEPSERGGEVRWAR